jgi:Flp pilus assembly protein TadG
MRNLAINMRRRSRRLAARLRAREFLGAEKAAAAVEFALLAAPFIAILVAILEVGLVFVAQQVLQTATNQAARMIMTGQAQNNNMTAAAFQSQVCANATALFDCGGIYVNVQTFGSFSSISGNTNNPVSNGTYNPGGLSYTPGNAGDIVVVQVYYKWPVYTAPLGFNLSNLKDGTDLLVATAAFRNEP